MKNTGDEKLVCIVVGERGAQDRVDYPRLGKRIYRNGEIVDLVDSESVLSVSAGKKV